MIGRTRRGVLTAMVPLAASSVARGAASPTALVAQRWIDGWNAKNPEKLVAAFTPDGVSRDVPFNLTKKGSAELRELHKYFHDVVSGLYMKLVETYERGGHGTIEWIFGGTDVGMYKTGKPFEVPGVSVMEVHGGRIFRTADYYDVATIMKQVGAPCR